MTDQIDALGRRNEFGKSLVQNDEVKETSTSNLVSYYEQMQPPTLLPAERRKITSLSNIINDNIVKTLKRSLHQSFAQTLMYNMGKMSIPEGRKNTLSCNLDLKKKAAIK